jgi:hypothetical protein
MACLHFLLTFTKLSLRDKLERLFSIPHLWKSTGIDNRKRVEDVFSTIYIADESVIKRNGVRYYMIWLLINNQYSSGRVSL